MRPTKAIITGMLILLLVILFLFAARQMNLHDEEQQEMETAILHNNARDMAEDSLKLQQLEAVKLANYIRDWKKFEDDLRDQLYRESTP